MTVSYTAEVMPIQIRPFLTTYVNLCWVIGQIICPGVSRALIDNTTEWAYKIPFAVQWIWPIPIVSPPVSIKCSGDTAESCSSSPFSWRLNHPGGWSERDVLRIPSGLSTDSFEALTPISPRGKFP